MIIEINPDEAPKPYKEGVNLYAGGGFINPRAFNAEFKCYPWYPFENLYFSEENICRLVSRCSLTTKMYRQMLPRSAEITKYYSVIDPTVIDVSTISQWFQYEEGIIWLSDGNLIINYFSDFTILSLESSYSKYIFGNEVRDLFSDSVSVFTEFHQSESIGKFMRSIRRTWGPS